MRRQLNNSTIFDWLESILSRSTDIMAAQQAAAHRTESGLERSAAQAAAV
jgi:hypothetical protein